MNKYNCKIVEAGESDSVDKFSFKYFFRQLLVCSVLWMNYFLYGLCVGGPTVYIPQLRKEANFTNAVSEEMASWLTSIYGYGSLPWAILLSVITAYFGQKISHILLVVNCFAGFIFFYLSSNVTEMLISQFMESAIGAAQATITVSIIAEFTSPQYRGFFLTFKSATFCWGIWISNAIGTYYHWKSIALLKLVLSIYPLVLVFFWPESPYWLASKGRLEKCAESHRWLKGCSISSEKELQTIKESQNYVENSKNLKYIFSKEYLKSIVLCVCVLGLFTFSGKLTCGYYSLDIIKKMTSSESASYTGMLILDGISVMGMYVGAILSEFFSRRSLFISATSIGILSLFSLGVYNYMIYASILVENVYISLVLLSLYSMGISCGPVIYCSSLYAECLPIKHRSFAMCLVAIYEKILSGTVTKLAPLVMKTLGLHAVFFFFGITSTVSLIFLYIFMPETKDKSLVQIAGEINGVKNRSKQRQCKLLTEPVLTE